MNKALKIALISGGVVSGVAALGGIAYGVYYVLFKDHTPVMPVGTAPAAPAPTPSPAPAGEPPPASL